METNFWIFIYNNIKGLHLKLISDFKRTSEFKVLNGLKKVLWSTSEDFFVY